MSSCSPESLVRMNQWRACRSSFPRPLRVIESRLQGFDPVKGLAISLRCSWSRAPHHGDTKTDASLPAVREMSAQKPEVAAQSKMTVHPEIGSAPHLPYKSRIRRLYRCDTDCANICVQTRLSKASLNVGN